MEALIRAALKALGVDRFVLGVHDAAFPMLPHEDTGRGSPYSQGASRLLQYAARLGFTGLQLGPQGMTHRGSPSPYEATLFTKNPLNLPLHDLGLLDDDQLKSLRGAATNRVNYRDVFARFESAQELLWQQGRAKLEAETAAFLDEHGRWLVPDALYGALCRAHGREYWKDWPDARDRDLFASGDLTRIAEHERRYAAEIRRHAFIQLLLRKSHLEFRARAKSLALQLYADLQIGYSAHDAWTQSGLFSSEYRMGAPPSRTNPEGQPWGYFVLNPDLFGTPTNPGPVLEFVRLRITRVLDDYDGVRVDHPHGWIDPWVYKAAAEDPLKAVQSGARLRSTPSDSNHPALERWSIARADQLNPNAPPYADDRVHSLEPEQVTAYATLLDEIVSQANARGIPADAMVCEVLSTLPNQVAATLERHRLGRFRVTQKAKLEDPTDVYRSENARPEDWIMLGNHDTPPIWAVVKRWRGEGVLEKRAAYLAARLRPEDPADFVRQLVGDEGLFVNAQLADALASPARNVFVFFTDLFGYTDVYNTPGTISDDNWSLRLPADFENLHATRNTLNLPLALALALQTHPTQENQHLAAALKKSVWHLLHDG